MKKTEETKKLECEFCHRTFSRERTILSHLCEKKQRWLTKDHISNRLAFQAWLQFYQKNSMSKTKNKTVEEFISSPYYIAFAKFGTYCADTNVLNVSRYVDWLLKNAIKIDDWNKDTVYTRYLIDYLKVEDPFDAIHRSVSYCIERAEAEGIQPNDLLRYGNQNRIIQAVVSGKISPWLLYQSDSGVRLLETFNQDQVTMIHDYINPEQWALKFHRNPDVAREIRNTLKDAGY